ncbi:MAG: hypothetical protein ACFFCV_10280 [Promethearchaeota archaeon]
MGLDRWIKTEDNDKNSKKKKKSPEQAKVSKLKGVKESDQEKQSIKLKKTTLVCPDAKCKYQKIIMKKELTNDDKICPRCNKTMKIK